MLDVVAMGELLIDFAAQSTDDDGAPNMAAHPGGAPCNVLAALSRYGAKTGFLGKVGVDTFGRLLEEHGVSLAMVTLGPKGCYLKTRAAASASAPAVRAVDTTGAGDIFGGSAVSRLLALWKHPAQRCQGGLLSIGRFACAAASLSTQAHGGIPSIPDRETVLQSMAP